MVLYTELNTPVCHANKRQSTEGTKPDYRLIGTSYLLYVLSVDVANCFLLGVVEADYCKSEVWKVLYCYLLVFLGFLRHMIPMPSNWRTYRQTAKKPIMQSRRHSPPSPLSETDNKWLLNLCLYLKGMAPLTPGSRRQVSIELFVCLYWQVQVKSHNFYIYCWGANVLFRVCISWRLAWLVFLLDTSSWLGTPVSWEMSLGDEHKNRNWTLPLQLWHFSWLFSSPHFRKFLFVKSQFAPNFSSQPSRSWPQSSHPNNNNNNNSHRSMTCRLCRR